MGTEGPIVCDKNCEKIHYIAKNIYCCGAGTAADTENTTELISSQLELHRYATRRQPRVVTALTMLKQMLLRYQGHVSAALVLGGVDCTGPHLHTVYPHGSTDELPYVSMGSGSLAAMAVLEDQFKVDSNVDICVLRQDSTRMLRNYECPNPQAPRRPEGYTYPRGTTEVLSETRELFAQVQVTDVPTPMEM